MSDQPSNAELAWRLEKIDDKLNGVIGRPEYLSDKQGLDYRFAEVKGHIDDLRNVHAEDVRELHARITEQAQSGRDNKMLWRQVLIEGALPALVSLAGVLVTLWIARGGR